MNWFRRHRDVIAFAAALALPLGIAVMLVPFRSSFANTASALVLVAVIVAVAVTGNRFTGLVATVSATLWFDLFLTRPYGRFAISHRPDIETAVSLFVVGVIVTELAARNRHHHESAAEESDYVALIYGLAELVASGAPAQEVVERARAELIDVLNLRDCRYEPQLSERRVARLDHDGNVIHAGMLWGAHNMGLPSPVVDLVVQARGQALGRFVLRPTPGYPVSGHRRVVAVAIADQVGAALRPQLRSA
jgi:K+-sensing histidine kinase KdpD